MQLTSWMLRYERRAPDIHLCIWLSFLEIIERSMSICFLFLRVGRRLGGCTYRRLWVVCRSRNEAEMSYSVARTMTSSFTSRLSCSLAGLFFIYTGDNDMLYKHWRQWHASYTLRQWHASYTLATMTCFIYTGDNDIFISHQNAIFTDKFIHHQIRVH